MADRNIQKNQGNNQNNQQDARFQLCDTPNAAFDGAIWMNSFQRANVEALSQALTMSTQGMIAIQEELLKFMTSRMNKDMEMAQDLMSGNIVGGVLNRQSEYVREMMQDYASGTQSLMERGLQLAMKSWTPLEERPDEATHEAKPAARRAVAQ